MNPYFHYEYPNGLQFVSLAPELALKLWLKLGNKKEEYPKLIGIWRFKKIHKHGKRINK